MKRNEINAALNSLRRIKMPKIEDKSLRNDLINNHYTLFDAGQKFDAAVDREREVILGAYKEDQQKLEEIQRELQASAPGNEQRELLKQANGFGDYYKAVAKFNEKVDEIGNVEVTGLKKIDRDKFMDEIQKQEFDLAMIEGLYPMFVLE